MIEDSDEKKSSAERGSMGHRHKKSPAEAELFL
jgi:hypothetical protein